MNRSPALPAVCRVCGDPVAVSALTSSRHRSHSCCADAHCRQVLQREDGMDAAAFDVYLAMQARAARLRRAQAARLVAARQQQALEDERFFDAMQAHLVTQDSVASGQDWRVVLPSGPTQSAPLPRQRRRRYIEHLLSIIHSAGLSLDDSPQASLAAETTTTVKPYGALTAQLCGVCRGGCCTGGADHGYLQPDSIQRLLARHPGFSVRQILRSYLAYLPKVSMVGGCINQTLTGCALPRSLRSTGCNQFMCTPMAAAQQRESVDPPLKIIWVLQRRLDHWQQLRSLTDNPVLGAVQVQRQGFVRLDWIPARPCD